MKKIIGLCVVILLSSVSVFAQDKKDRKPDYNKRQERLAERLNLDEKQKADFQKLNEKYADKMKNEWKSMQAQREEQKQKMLALREQKNEEVKKILTEEQFKTYLEKQRPEGRNKHSKMKDQKRKSDRPGKSDKTHSYRKHMQKG